MALPLGAAPPADDESVWVCVRACRDEQKKGPSDKNVITTEKQQQQHQQRKMS